MLHPTKLYPYFTFFARIAYSSLWFMRQFTIAPCEPLSLWSMRIPVLLLQKFEAVMELFPPLMIHPISLR